MSQNDDLSGSQVLITGASAGIGLATAELFARNGADLVIGARSEGTLETTATSLSETHDVTVEPVYVDVANESAVSKFVETAVETLDGIDIAVHAAGIEREYGENVQDIETSNYQQMMDTNVDGTFYVTQQVLPHLIERSGTLVLLGSFAGQYPRPASPVYAASKWWVRGFARSVQSQVGPEGVSVSVINPSEVRTDWQGSADATPLREQFTEDEASDPEEIADAIRFVATCDAPNSVVELDLYRRNKLDEF